MTLHKFRLLFLAIVIFNESLLTALHCHMLQIWDPTRFRDTFAERNCEIVPGVVVAVVVLVARRLVDGVRAPLLLLVALLAHGVLRRPHDLHGLDVP